MLQLKKRLFALLLVAVCAGLLYYEWQSVKQEGRYSIKVATFAPLGIIGGLFLLLFPSKFGKPETAWDKLIVLLVFILGLAAGLVNWYLIDPGSFPFR
jgi:CDP-diglyceride synthetase